VILVQDTVAFDINLASYEKLEEHVKTIFREFAEQVWGECQRSLSPHIIVLPGTGTYLNQSGAAKYVLKLNYCGSLSDFYYMAYLELSRIFLDALKDVRSYEGDKEDGKGKLRVVLDLSHGINYMPVLTYRAVRDLLEAAALLHTVELEVVNSEPVKTVTRGAKGVGESSQPAHVHIHIAERSPLIPRTALTLSLDKSYKAKLLSLESRCLDSEDPKELGEKIRDRAEEIFRQAFGKEDLCDLAALASSISHGMPLLILYELANVNASLGKFVEEVIGAFRTFIKMEPDEGRGQLRIRRLARLEVGVEQVARVLFILEILRLKGLQGSKEATLKDINKVRDIYKGIKAISTRIDRDLWEIASALAAKPQICDGKYHLLAEVLGRDICAQIRSDNVNFQRNLLAHSGLEMCVTQISCPEEMARNRLKAEEVLEKWEDKVKVRYSDEHLKEVIKAAQQLISS